MSGEVEEAQMTYIIRDHDHDKFIARKNQLQDIANKINEESGSERVNVTLFDQYYNMKDIIEKDLSIVDLAEKAMINLGIKPIIEPIRGGTDGSKLSFMGLPTPNIFAVEKIFMDVMSL